MFIENKMSMGRASQRGWNFGLGWLIPRIPAFLLCAGILTLFVALPYRSLDADVTTFGLMGNDLLRLGYWPTLTYGQNYLFSFTPYSYALLRWLFPSLEPGLALVLGGAVFSITGLWLLAESLLILLRSRGEEPLLPLGLFCLAVGASSLYVLDIEICSSIEISLFLLGLIFYAAARLESGTRERPDAGLARWWFMLGLATSATLYTRPQIALYGVPLIIAFLAGVRRRHGLPAAKRRGWVLVLGAIVGYLPMLAHLVFRAADWPFRHHVHSKVALLKLGETVGRFFTLVAARIFGVCADYPVFSVLSLAWVAAALLAFGLAWRRNRARPGQVTALDAAWVIGSLGMIVIMMLVPVLAGDAASRRYCLHVLPAVAWLFARFVPAVGWRRVAAAAMVISLAAASVPVWWARLADEVVIERSVREAKDRFIPELLQSHAVILTDYWDAYLLAFLADGRMKIEAYPWDLVRTYGLVSRDEMSRRTLWLVKSGHGQSTRDRLIKDLGPGFLDRVRSQNLREPLLERECELWDVGEAEAAVALMQKHQGRYFTTPYPPGSGGAERP